MDVLAGVKAGGVSLYFGDDPIYHFDLDGRWQRAFLGGLHYLKGLDATVRSIGRDREGGAWSSAARPWLSAGPSTSTPRSGRSRST